MPLDFAYRSNTISATLNYLQPSFAERPYSYAYAPKDGTPRSNIVAEPHDVPVRDIRSDPRAFTLDGAGFAVVTHDSKVSDFRNEAQVRTLYYPEAERLLKQLTGADRVHIFDHTLRRRVPGLEDDRNGPRQPATRVHVDHTAKSGPQRVRDLLPNEADELLRGRVQVINLWRPINHPVYDAPLAVADAGTVPFSDLVPSDLIPAGIISDPFGAGMPAGMSLISRAAAPPTGGSQRASALGARPRAYQSAHAPTGIIYPDRVGETYGIRYNPAHRWYYLSEQRPDEVLLLKCYDSRTDVARFAPHGAFLMPFVRPDLPMRESIELRTFVFHKA
jgi:hypothetical protein